MGGGFENVLNRYTVAGKDINENEKVCNALDVKKVLSLYGIPEKYIKVMRAMYENNTAAVKVGNEVSNWFCIKSGVKRCCVLSPLIWIFLIDFVLRSTGKAIGDHGIKWGGKTLLDRLY